MLPDVYFIFDEYRCQYWWPFRVPQVFPAPGKWNGPTVDLLLDSLHRETIFNLVSITAFSSSF